MTTPSNTPPPEHRDETLPQAKSGRYERAFERFLWNSRLLVMLAVVPSLLGALVLFIIGTLDILKLTVTAATYYLVGGQPDIHETVVPSVVMAVDIYLALSVLALAGALYLMSRAHKHHRE